jgi:hypothetical protein
MALVCPGCDKTQLLKPHILTLLGPNLCYPFPSHSQQAKPTLGYMKYRRNIPVVRLEVQKGGAKIGIPRFAMLPICPHRLPGPARDQRHLIDIRDLFLTDLKTVNQFHTPGTVIGIT